MQSDPIEQILEVILAHPKLFQEHGDMRILQFLNENNFIIEEKRLLRATNKVIDLKKLGTYLEEYRVFRSVINTVRTLSLWIIEKEGGEGIEWERDQIFLTTQRLGKDISLLNGFIPRFKGEVKDFFLRFSLKPNKPEAARELELLFDRITNNLIIVQHGMQQLLDSSLGRTMIMPEKAGIAVFEELIHDILDLVARLEGFIQSMFLPFIEKSSIRLLDGENLHEFQNQLRTLTKNALKIQQLAIADSQR